LYNNDNDPKTDLRKELIEVLQTQIQGEISFTVEPESTLTIYFPKRELKGPHSTLEIED
jgi:nitrogen fixation protein